MKLLQLNVWQSRLHKPIMNLIAEAQPDILCLQEICSSDCTFPLWPGLAGYEAIANALPDYESAFAPCFAAPLFGGSCKFGNAIFSRYPLSNLETIFINGKYTETEQPTKITTNIRNLQRATVATPQGEFTLINHHAYWVPNELGDETSVAKLAQVARICDQSPKPLILAGDMNVIPESPALRSIQAVLTDLTHTHKIPTTLSSLGKLPDIPCDHICVSDEVKVNSFEVRQEIVSDHLALILEFSL